jgi:hypothetical protein
MKPINSTDKKEISANTLGRYRADYDRIRALNIPDVDSQVSARMSMDAALAGMTLDELKAKIDALSKPSGEGKRDAEKAHRDRGISKTAVVATFMNEVAELGKTDIKAFQAALIDLQKEMHQGIGNVTMLWTPTVDFDKLATGERVEINPEMRFAPYIGGWGDGSKNPRFQYTFRAVPISKTSGYRKDAFELVRHETLPKEKPVKKVKEEAKQ